MLALQTSSLLYTEYTPTNTFFVALYLLLSLLQNSQLLWFVHDENLEGYGFVHDVILEVIKGLLHA